MGFSVKVIGERGEVVRVTVERPGMGEGTDLPLPWCRLSRNIT